MSGAALLTLPTAAFSGFMLIYDGWGEERVYMNIEFSVSSRTVFLGSFIHFAPFIGLYI